MNPDQFFGSQPQSNTPDMSQSSPSPQTLPQSQPQQSGVSPSDFFGSQQQDPNADKGFFGNIGSGNIFGALKDAGNFAFPIVGDVVNDIYGRNQKTALQQLGDAGLSALWFVPGFGDAADAAIQGGRAAAEVAGEGALRAGAEAAGEGAVKAGAEAAAPAVMHPLAALAGNPVAQGVMMGYGADVSSKLSQGDTNLQDIATPGAGTAVGGIAGAVLPSFLNIIGKKYSQEGALATINDNLRNVFMGNKTTTRWLTEAENEGLDPMGTIARGMSLPDVENGKIVSTAAMNKEQEYISQLSSVRAKALDAMGSVDYEKGGTFVPPPALKDIRQRVLDDAEKKFTGTALPLAQRQINNEFANYIAKYSDNPSFTDIEHLKESLNPYVKYTGGDLPTKTLTYQIMQNAFRKTLEDGAEASGIPGLSDFNKLIQQHYKAYEGLDMINGSPVKNGRLGNIIRSHVLAGASAVVGGMTGGIVPAIGAAAGTEWLSNVLADRAAARTFSNPFLDKLVSKIAEQNPEVVQKFMDAAGIQGKAALEKVPEAGSAVANTAAGGASLGEKAAISSSAQANSNGHTPGQIVTGGDGKQYMVDANGNYTQLSGSELPPDFLRP